MCLRGSLVLFVKLGEGRREKVEVGRQKAGHFPARGSMRKTGGHAFVQGGSTPGGGALVESMPSGLVTSYPSKVEGRR